MLQTPPYHVSVRKPGGGLKTAEVKGGWDPAGFALLTVFVYGFNNDVPDEWSRWSEKTWPGIRSLITPHSDGGTEENHGIILFSWPGDSTIGKAFSPFLYPWRVRPAIKAGVLLAEYLKKIAPHNSGLRVQFVGHSLGCRVILSAVGELATEPQVPVARVLLMGAAVPEGDCTGPGPWPKNAHDLFDAAQGDGIAAGSDVILHSRDDEALGWKFLLGEKEARRLGVKSYGSHNAVGLTGGPDTVPVRWTGEVTPCSGLRHSDYLTDKGALRHVASLFGTLASLPSPTRSEGRRQLDQHEEERRQLASAPRIG